MNLKANHKPPTTFYLVRHAETLGNVEEKMIGQKESPLTANGVVQAQELASRLKDIRFDLAFSSDLSRSVQTAEIICKPQNLRVNIEPSIKELSFGKYEGWKSEEFMNVFGDIVKQREQMNDEERLAHVVDPTIETDLSAASRMARFLNETAQNHPGKTILVVSHGAIMRTSMIYLKLFTYQTLPHGAIKNCSFIIVKKSDDSFQLEKFVGVDLN